VVVIFDHSQDRGDILSASPLIAGRRSSDKLAFH